MELFAVREGLKLALQEVEGLRVFDYVPDTVSPPAAIVEFPETWTFDKAMGRGLDECFIPVLILVSRATDRAGNRGIEDYLSTGHKSIKAAIEADKTLDGACASLRVTEARDFGNFTVGTTEHFGLRFVVHIVG